jgi:hypothetical protein
MTHPQSLCLLINSCHTGLYEVLACQHKLQISALMDFIEVKGLAAEAMTLRYD